MWLFKPPPHTHHEDESSLTRVQTSAGSFVVALDAHATVADLLAATNALLAQSSNSSSSSQSRSSRSRSRSPHVVAALVTADGDALGAGLRVARATVRNQELVALSAAEAARLPPRVHPFFAANGLLESAVVTTGVSTSTVTTGTTATLTTTTASPSKDRASLSVFVSYCWANSFLAFGDKAVGALDPRALRQHLALNGFSDVWLDIEKMATGDDLFEQIANGLMTCDVVIVCVSDEYAVSKNCLRELNFALNVLKLPYIPLVVGKGFNWQKTKVGLMFGDQLYLDATDPNQVIARMDSVLDALDKKIESKISISSATDAIDVSIVLDDGDDDNTAPVSSPALQSSPSTSLPGGFPSLDSAASAPAAAAATNNNNTSSSHNQFDFTFSQTPQLNLTVGETVEVLRWRRNYKNYFVAGGLHYVPVQIVELGPPIYSSSSNNQQPPSCRMIKVLFQSRVRYTKTRNGPVKAIVVNEDTEWVDEFLIRKVLEMPKQLPDLDVGDAVEFRQYIKRERRRNGAPTSATPQVSDNINNDVPSPLDINSLVPSSVVTTSSSAAMASETGSIVSDDPTDEDQDTYVFLPAFITAKLANRKYLLKQSRGMGLVAESGDYASVLKPVGAKLLRAGHDARMVRVRQALNAKALVILEKGSIVRPQCIPDLDTPPSPPAQNPITSNSATADKILKQVATQMLAFKAKELVSPPKQTPKKQQLEKDSSNLSLREKFMNNSIELWRQANLFSFRTDAFKNTVVWLSYTFPSSGGDGQAAPPPPPPSSSSTSKTTIQPSYIAKTLRQRNVHVLDHQTELGDTTTTTDLDQDDIQETLYRGIVKSSLFLALITPEYLASETHRKEIEYAKTLGLPVLYALITPITATTAPLDTGSSSLTTTTNNNNKDALEFLHLINRDSIIDFTIHKLIWCRMDTLIYRMNQLSVAQNKDRRAARYADQDPKNVPWLRNFLNLNSGSLLESLNCIVLENVPLVVVDLAEVGEGEKGVEGTTTAEAITATAAVCGLAWTTHRSAMSFNSKPADKRTAQAQSIISPANVLSLTTTWSYEGDIEWDGATTASKLQFKPTRLTRYVMQPEDVENGREWKVGDLVEVRLHWVSGLLGDQCLWWPCKIVKLLNTIELLVVMHHSDVSPPTHLPIIKVTIAQLRSGHDPRATKWFPAGQFYQEHVEKTVERADGTISTIVLKQPRIRLGTEITNRYSLLMKTDPAAKARALLKPVLRTPDEVKFSMRSEDGNHHHHTKTFTSIMSAQELKSIVSRLDNDPDPLLWTDGVTVEPQEAAAAAGGGGSLIHFDNWNPRCVTSKYPFLERSTPTRPIYVEVKILDLGWSPNAGYAAVSIGIIPQFYPPFMMVGWHGRSIGYHSLNGRKLKSDDVDWSIQGVPYSIGDVVGVGMDLHGSVYFTLNREWMFKSKVGNSGLMFYLGVSCDGPGTVFVDPVAEPDAAWLN